VAPVFTSGLSRVIRGRKSRSGFHGKIYTGNPWDFPMKIMGLSGVNFPVKTNPLFNEHSNGFPKKNHVISKD